MPSSEIHKTNTNRNGNPYIELLFGIRDKKMGHPLVLGMPHTRGRYRLAHGGDSLEDNAAHERDAHAEAGEGERAVHAHLDATSIESNGEDGEDRTDCEAGDAHAVEGGLGVGVGVHVEILSVGCSSFDNKDIRGLMAFCI